MSRDNDLRLAALDAHTALHDSVRVLKAYIEQLETNNQVLSDELLTITAERDRLDLIAVSLLDDLEDSRPGDDGTFVSVVRF